jgi:hypothetical protein
MQGNVLLQYEIEMFSTVRTVRGSAGIPTA